MQFDFSGLESRFFKSLLKYSVETKVSKLLPNRIIGFNPEIKSEQQ